MLDDRAIEIAVKLVGIADVLVGRTDFQKRQ
jgi:hypothetical protein